MILAQLCASKSQKLCGWNSIILHELCVSRGCVFVEFIKICIGYVQGKKGADNLAGLLKNYLCC